MGNVLDVGVKFLKKEGIGKFIIRTIHWIPEYANWWRLRLRSYLFERVDSYRGHVKRGYLQEETEIDAYTKYSRIIGGMEYCRLNKQPYKILNQGEVIEVVLPICFEEKSDIQKTLFDSPPIYLTTFVEVEVYGNTNLLTKGDIALSDLYWMDKGKNRYDIEGGCIVSCHRRGKWIRAAYKKTDAVVEEAIYCIGLACKNYYHFTFEILSRLAFVDRFEEYREIPVLVDEASLQIPQMKDLFERVNICHHPIIPVGNCTRVHVKKLIYVSRNLWMPPNFRSNTVTVAGDFMISRSVVDNIRNRVLENQDNREHSAFKKIYLSRRNCTVQRLTNANQIEKIFSDHGYQIIFMEELTFEEEVAVFHGADVIVGATGAAFTNMIYCHEGAKLGIIIPSENDVYFFSNIANMLNVEFVVVGADIVQKDKYASRDTFSLDTEKCERFIESVDG